MWTRPFGWLYYYSHFTDESLEAWEVKPHAGAHTAPEWQDRSSDPDGPVLGSTPLAPPWDCDICLLLGSGRLFGSFLSLGGYVETLNKCWSEFQWRCSGKPPKEVRHAEAWQRHPHLLQIILVASSLWCPFYHCVPSFFVDTVGHSVDQARPRSASVHHIIDSQPYRGWKELSSQTE